MHSLLKVAVIGDLIVDIKGYYRGILKPGLNILLENPQISPGGVAGNIAWYLRQFNIDVHVYSAIGSDQWGKFLLEKLKTIKVNTRHVKVVRGTPTGFLVLVVDETGERTMIGSRGANEKLVIEYSDLISLKPDWIHLSGYMLLNKEKTRIFENFRKACRDLNIPCSIDLEGCGWSDWLKLEDMLVIVNEENKPPVDVKAKALIIKAGSKGCILKYGDTTQFFKVKSKIVKDTTGAGDAFNSALIASVLNNKSVSEACTIAVTISSYKVSRKGTWIEIPKHLKTSLEHL